jgi:hypothetical protein
LRKKLRELKQERDILAKATAWFAREKGDVPPKSSSSQAMWHRHRRTRPNFRLVPCVVSSVSAGVATTRGGSARPRNEIEETRC